MVYIYWDTTPWASNIEIDVCAPGAERPTAGALVHFGLGWPDPEDDTDEIFSVGDSEDRWWGPAISREWALSALSKAPDGSSAEMVDGMLRIAKSRVSSDVPVVRRCIESDDPVVRYVTTWQTVRLRGRASAIRRSRSVP